jgi:preprotein translocase subunit SecG
MSTVILVIHLLIAAALVGVVLLQRSEGGALGIGGGGGGGFMSGRGTANLLTRVTAGLAVAFFITSIALTILAKQSVAPESILEGAGQTQGVPGEGGSGGILDQLREGQQPPPSQQEPSSQQQQPDDGPQVPQSQ